MATARIGQGGRGRCRNSSSPVTGGGARQPTLCWTPERQIIYAQMKADYDANTTTPATLGGKYYKTIKYCSDQGLDGTYGTGFIWSAFLYQVTGDTTYSDRAWSYINTEFIERYDAGTINLSDLNRPRETLQPLVLGLDWLWPALTADQRASYQELIGIVLDNALGGNQFVAEGYAGSDSDQLIAYYFAVCMFYLICPTDARAAYWFTFVSTSTTRLDHGGLTSTASNRSSSARNCIRHYVETLASGGEWCESTEYNAHSTHYVLNGYDAIRTHLGTATDYFPEITAWLPDLAERQMAIWTQDFDTMFKWGDVEHPETGDLPFDSFHIIPTNIALCGLLQGTTRGEQLQDFVESIYEVWSPYVNWASGGFANFDTPHGYMTFNPYANRGDHTTRAKTWHADGTGMTIQKSGFASSDSLFAIAYGNRADERYLDHMPAFFGHFSLYKNNEWVLDYPQVYGVNVWGQFVNNTPLMCGLSWCYEYNHIQHQTDGFLFNGTDTYCYGVCTTAGCTAGFTPLFDPPPVNVHEWTREIFFAGGTTDTIIVFDRGYVDAPTSLTKYPATHQTAMANAPSRHQFMFQIHDAVALTYADSRYGWSTPESATPMRWYPLLPAVQTRTVYDLDADNTPTINWNQVYAGAGSTGAAERATFDQVRIWPTVQASWHTFLNVFQAGATPGAVTLLEDSGKVQGVHVVRTGQSDLVVLFNSQQSAALNTTAFHASHDTDIPLQRFRETGFTVSWTASASVTDIFFNDLNPANTWTRNIDGGGSVAITEDSGGHFRTEHAGTGAHTMVVTGV